MSPVQAQLLSHPRTLLGAARMTLERVEGALGQHEKAHAACRLGYHEDACRLWEVLACANDADALYQLGRMAELGLGEPHDALRARTLFLRAAQAGHAGAAARLDEKA